VKQYTGEVSSEPVMLRVYPGADGTMTLYEDDGASFDYEKGAFTRIVCNWNDGTRTLSLKADAKGTMPHQRAFTVEMAGGAGSKRVVMSGTNASVVL
jgi:alpha-D-xyloside xylohydrolase